MTIGATAATGASVRAHKAAVQQCPDFPFPATRDPSNPLALPSAPGANPLGGAHLFVDGPRHGNAAGAIAQLLGLDPTTYPDNYSWTQFKADISPGGSQFSKLAGNSDLANKVALLSKIADQEETQNLSLFAQGGGPGAIYSQVQKILCHNLTADPNPNTVPVFSTFFIYPNGQFCPSLSAIQGNEATFKRQIDEVAAATGRHPAVFLLEIDSVGTSLCLTPDELTAWEGLLRYEIEQLTALPHSVVYVEGGAADEDTPDYVAKVLNDICVVQGQNVCAGLRGFYVNGTHFDWTLDEITWANDVAAQLQTLIQNDTHTTYVPHFVVNTAQNGQGPKLNPHPVQQGIEDLCNPTGRGLGRAPTANTNPTVDGQSFPLTDAFLWTGVPGRSHNSNCHPGDAAAGVFDVNFALELATNASDQLAPSLSQLPPPVLGQSVDVGPISGTVYVKLPLGHAAADGPHASAALTKGKGFVQLTEARQLPTGTEFDARQGSLQVNAASVHLGKTITGVFGGGLFKLTQDGSGLHKGLATLALEDGTFRGAPSYARCPKHAAADQPGPIAQAALSKLVLQTLHSSVHGSFRTKTRSSSGTVRGTKWDTLDRCDGTLTVVRRGTVLVNDFGRHVTVAVHAGHSYLAKALRRLH